MLLVVTDRNADQHRADLDRLFRLRYDNFIVRRQWSLPIRNGLETDQYDNEHAVHFINYEDEGCIAGSARVHDTTHGSLLADFFPHLVQADEPARGPGIFEGTRFIVSPALKTREAHQCARADLVIQIVQWCMEQGGTHLQAVIDFSMLSTFQEMSLKTRVLGLPHEYGGGPRVPGGGKCIAFRWGLTQALLNDFEDYRRSAIRMEADGVATFVH